jgi:hypothetical protein
LIKKNEKTRGIIIFRPAKDEIYAGNLPEVLIMDLYKSNYIFEVSIAPHDRLHIKCIKNRGWLCYEELFNKLAEILGIDVTSLDILSEQEAQFKNQEDELLFVLTYGL